MSPLFSWLSVLVKLYNCILSHSDSLSHRQNSGKCFQILAFVDFYNNRKHLLTFSSFLRYDGDSSENPANSSLKHSGCFPECRVSISLKMDTAGRNDPNDIKTGIGLL